MIVKNLEKKEQNTASFQVESDAAEFETAVNNAYLKNKKDIYIPGFRKGKAPRAVIEGMYGKEVFYQDAMDELAPAAFEFGLNEYELKIVGAPAIEDVNITEERTVAYTFGVTLFPEVTLGEYKGLSAPKTVKPVTDGDVDKELDDVRRRNARLVNVDDRAAQMGDTATIDFEGFKDGVPFDGGKGEDYALELGSNTFVPGFEEQVVGMKVGEEKDLDITFPENYTEELAGAAVVFKVKLNELSYSELPELDDEFAKDVSEFDTLAEYKDSLRKELEKTAEEQAEGDFRTAIMKQACDNMTVEIPSVMVDDKVEEALRNYAANFGMTDKDMSLDKLLEMFGFSEEVVNNNLRPNAEMQIKTELLIDEVVKAEDIQVTDEETEEYLNKMAENIGAKPEDVKQYFGDDFVAAELKKEKAGNIIFDSAVVAAE